MAHSEIISGSKMEEEVEALIRDLLVALINTMVEVAMEIMEEDNSNLKSLLLLCQSLNQFLNLKLLLAPVVLLVCKRLSQILIQWLMVTTNVVSLCFQLLCLIIPT